MKKLFISVFTLTLFFGCQSPQSSQDEKSHVSQPMDTVTNGLEEKRVNEIRPKLTQMLTAAETALDAQEFIKEDTMGNHRRRLVLRTDGATWPVVLEVENSAGYSVFYFQNRKLMAVEKPSERFILEQNKMKVWADRNWNPMKSKTTEEWIDQENVLLKEVANYLALFDIKYQY
jgi:hypothetical protein